MSDAMKIITAILLLLSGFMAYNLYFGSKGVETYKGIAQQLEREEHKALELQKRNQEVTDQVTEFRRQGSVAIEELARSELGLIKPNERFYRVIATDEEIINMPLPDYH